MAAVIRMTEEQGNAAIGLVPSLLPPSPVTADDTDLPDTNRSDFYETMKASFLRENAILGLIGKASPETGRAIFGDDPDDYEAYPALAPRLRRQEAASGEGLERDPNFNPVQYIQSSWTEDEINAYEWDIRNGFFDHATSPGEVEQRAVELTRERRLLETIAHGSSFAATLGALGAAVSDVTTYVPVYGAASKAVAAARMGRLLGSVSAHGLSGFLAVGAQESLLQSQQHLRSAQESFLNIAVGTAIGGGIGVFARVIKPKHPLNPHNPSNPLHPDNMGKQGFVERDGLGNETVVGHTSTVGAAGTIPTVGDAVPGVFSKIPGLNWVGEKIRTNSVLGTPSARILKWRGPVTRYIATKLADRGGILSDTERYGVSLGAAAEDIKLDWGVRKSALLTSIDGTFRNLNRALGQSAVTSRLGFSKIAAHEWMDEIIFPKLLGTYGDDAADAIRKRFGVEGGNLILQKADETVESIHAANALHEQRLVELGALRDRGKVDALQGEVDGLRKEIKSGTAQRRATVEAARKAVKDIRAKLKDDHAKAKIDTNAKIAEARKAEPGTIGEKVDAIRQKAAVDRKARIAKVNEKIREHNQTIKAENEATKTEFKGHRERISSLRSSLETESRKPEALGRDYGAAILYDRAGIDADPAGFERFLRDVLVERPSEDWLVSNYGLSADKFTKLGKETVEITRNGDAVKLSKEEGQKLRDEIMDSWLGGEKNHILQQAELAEASAAERLKNAELDFADILRAHRLVSQQTARVDTKVGRTIRDNLAAKANVAKAKRNEARLFHRAFTSAAEAARTMSLARLLQELPVLLKDVGEKELGIAMGRARELAEIRAARGSKSAKKEAQTNLRDAVEKAFETPLKTKKVLEPTRDDIIAAMESRARVYAQELRRASTELKTTNARFQAVSSQLSRLVEKQTLLKGAKKSVAASLKAASKARTEAAKDARKATGAKVRAEKQAPMDVVIEEIMSRIQNRAELPQAILDRVAPETGRVKGRTLPLTPEQRQQGMRLGFIRGDLAGVINAQHDQLSGWFGLHEALDIRPGGAFESWGQIVDKVTEEYNGLAARAGSPKKAAKVQAERKAALRDLNVLKGRILGISDVGMDRDGFLYWGAQKVLQANLMRYAAGFLPASFGDLATASVISRGLHKHLFANLSEVTDLMTTLYEKDPGGFRSMVAATEIGHNSTRFIEMADAADTLNATGIGPRESFGHNLTSHIDRAMSWTTDKVHIASGMRVWNRFNKIATAVIRKYDLRDKVGKWASLSPKEKTGLASLGIGESEAKAIHSFIQKYAPDKAGRKYWDPNLDAWEKTKEGREAARAFRVAIIRDMNRAVPTPGIGDKPVLMNHMMGKIWLQFMSYSFSMMNRFLAPSSQKIATWKDAQSMMAFVHLMWLGGATVIAKDLISGRDPKERFKPEKAYETMFEIFDRAGLMGYLSPMVDSALKVSAPIQEAAFGRTLVGPTSRFARNAWAESLLGANYGLFRDIQQFGSSIAEGDKEKLVKKGLILLPANTFSRLINQFATD